MRIDLDFEKKEVICLKCNVHYKMDDIPIHKCFSCGENFMSLNCDCGVFNIPDLLYDYLESYQIHGNLDHIPDPSLSSIPPLTLVKN